MAGLANGRWRQTLFLFLLHRHTAAALAMPVALPDTFSRRPPIWRGRVSAIGQEEGEAAGDASERTHLASIVLRGHDGRYRLRDQSCASSMTAASGRYRHAGTRGEATASVASYCLLLHACLLDTLISVGPLSVRPRPPPPPFSPISALQVVMTVGLVSR